MATQATSLFTPVMIWSLSLGGGGVSGVCFCEEVDLGDSFFWGGYWEDHPS